MNEDMKEGIEVAFGPAIETMKCIQQPINRSRQAFPRLAHDIKRQRFRKVVRSP
jgi:hypothetical protein